MWGEAKGKYSRSGKEFEKYLEAEYAANRVEEASA
jgi:hypothetical protein